MKVGDLVELKPSVLHKSQQSDYIGVITGKHNDAVKVFWFSGTSVKPSSSQYTLKLRVISSL